MNYMLSFFGLLAWLSGCFFALNKISIVPLWVGWAVLTIGLCYNEENK